MSKAIVKQFLAKVDIDLELKKKVRTAKMPDRALTISKIVNIGSDQGFDFTAEEYESVIASELKAVFANHRSIFHHHVINVE